VFFNLCLLLELCRQSLSEDSVSSWCCSGKHSLCSSVNEGAVTKCTADSRMRAKAAVRYYPSKTCSCCRGSSQGCCRRVADTADWLLLCSLHGCLCWCRQDRYGLSETSLWPTAAMDEHTEWVVGSVGDSWMLSSAQAEEHIQRTSQRYLQILARAGEAFFSPGLIQMCLYLCCGYNLHQ